MAKKVKLPEKRRKYHGVYELDKGLDYSKPSTTISEGHTPNCEEVLFRYKEVQKAKGTTYFANTDTSPLDSTIMHIDQYYKQTGADRLIVHTLTNVLYYDPPTNSMVGIVATWKNLPCRVTATHISGSTNLICQVTSERDYTNLICKVIVWALHTDLICRVTVPSFPATANLICRVTTTNLPGTANLVCKVDAEPITWNLVCRVEVMSA